MAQKVAEHYGVADRHRIIPLPFLKQFGASALTDESIEVPKRTPLQPKTFPSLMCLAATCCFYRSALPMRKRSARRRCISASTRSITAVTPTAVQNLLKRRKCSIWRPKRGWKGDRSKFAHRSFVSKREIVTRGTELNVPYELDHIVFITGTVRASGSCDSCRLRWKGFAEAGFKGPDSISMELPR